MQPLRLGAVLVIGARTYGVQAGVVIASGSRTAGPSRAAGSAYVQQDPACPKRALSMPGRSLHSSARQRMPQSTDAKASDGQVSSTGTASDGKVTTETESGTAATPIAGQQPKVAEDEGEAKPNVPQSSSEFAAQDKKPLPYLSAPLGVAQRPSSKKLTWAERRERQFDNELRLERRKAIVKEATRGYFHDIHAMRSHGGKTWLAPTTLIRQDRALFFPAIAGTCLADKQKKSTADMLPGKVSLVCILTSQVSEQHTKSFYAPTFEVYKDDPNFQLVQINLQENVLKAALVSLFMSSLRRQVAEPLQSTYLLTHQDLTVERDAIALHNKHVGYTYLVGPEGKIRWAGGGFAERQEAQALVACTGVLLSRLAEDKAGTDAAKTKR